MAELQKGYISTIEGNTARVVPDQVDGSVTKPLTIHASLRGDAGSLKKGTAVVFVVFSDRSGLILSRVDGEIFAPDS